MKIKLLISALVIAAPFSYADLSTAYTSSQENTYQTPAHFEHVFGASDSYKKEVIEKGVGLDEVLGLDTTYDDEQEQEPVRSESYLAWKKFCENGTLTKEEYLIIDEGDIPPELLENCKVKGKAFKGNNASSNK